MVTRTPLNQDFYRGNPKFLCLGCRPTPRCHILLLCRKEIPSLTLMLFLGLNPFVQPFLQQRLSCQPQRQQLHL